MAVISEIPDDQTKKPQEDEEKEKQAQNRPISFSIQDERFIQGSYNPTPAYFFLHLIASPGNYDGDVITTERLSRHGPLTFAFVGFPTQNPPNWYILLRESPKLIPNETPLALCRLDLPPSMPIGSAVVTIGSAMYLFGGRTSRVFLLDSNSDGHKWQELPSMTRNRYRAAAGVIDGKIYVIGGCQIQPDWIEVFDVKNQVWDEPVRGPYPYASGTGEFLTFVVMEDKIYVLDYDSCFSYQPKKRKWESWLGVTGLRSLWQGCSCVVDDMLYTIDPRRTRGHRIVVYDPEEEDWKGVYLGETGRRLPKLFYYTSKMANLSGKLVILGCKQCMYTEPEKEIWCIMIALERGEISGKVETVEHVLTSTTLPYIELCRTATI